MLDLCRICLFTIDETNCVSVFSKMSDNKSVLELMKECSSIQVLDEDELPKYICTKCVEKLNLLYGFRNLIINSDLQLKEKLKAKREHLESLASQATIKDEHQITSELCLASDEEFETEESKLNEMFVDTNCNEDFLEEPDTDLKDPEPANIITDVKENITEKKSLKRRGTSKELEKLIKVKTKLYRCKECNITFKSIHRYKNHKVHHTGIVPYSCEFCNKGFCSKGALIVHTRVHTGDKPFTCSVCQKNFGSPSSLFAHKRVHSGVKKFNCDVCSRGFYQLSQLQVHMRRHTGEKPYMCEICSKTFGETSSLTRHLRRHQGELAPCPICGKTYKGQTGLQSHLKRHSGVKRFTCNECGGKFTEQNSLNIHKVLHLGLKPFKCKFCDKSFSQRSVLSRHLMIHSGEKPFCCTLCSNVFTYKHHLQGHMKSHHKDVLVVASSSKTDNLQLTAGGSNLEKSTSVT